jgi:hypothetical protein
MDERAGFDAQREAKRETLGQTSRSTYDRMWEGLTKYLAAEARHARKAAVAEKDASQEEDRSRRSR